MNATQMLLLLLLAAGNASAGKKTPFCNLFRLFYLIIALLQLIWRMLLFGISP